MLFFKRRGEDRQAAMYARSEEYQAQAKREELLINFGNLLRQFANNPDKGVAAEVREGLIKQMQENKVTTQELRRGAIAVGFTEQEATHAMLELNLNKLDAE